MLRYHRPMWEGKHTRREERALDTRGVHVLRGKPVRREPRRTRACGLEHGPDQSVALRPRTTAQTGAPNPLPTGLSSKGSAPDTDTRPRAGGVGRPRREGQRRKGHGTATARKVYGRPKVNGMHGHAGQAVTRTHTAT